MNGAKPTKNRPHDQHGKFAEMVAFLGLTRSSASLITDAEAETGANGGCNRRVPIGKGHSCICYELGCSSLKSWNVLREVFFFISG